MGEVNQTQGIMTKEQFNASPLKNIMSYQDYILNALRSGSAFTFNLNWTQSLTNNNQIFNFGTTNPIKKNAKEDLIERAQHIKDPEVRKHVIDGLCNIESPSEAFYNMLIKKYDKQSADFEVAWEEYQQTKNQAAFYKKVLATLAAKYEDSESGYEQGLVRQAQNNYKNANIYSDIALGKASDIAHKPTALYFG